MYSEKIMEIFSNLKNVREIPNADAKATAINTICKDKMTVFLKIEENKIKDIGIKTFGCVAAIVSADALAEFVKGKTLKQAKKITAKEVLNELGGLPKPKTHCSVLAIDALKKAIEEYEKEHNKQV